MKIDSSFPVGGNEPAENVPSTQTPSRAVGSYVSGGQGPDSILVGGEDKVSLSSTMSEVQQLKAQLAQTPDVRASRVASLQQQIAQGTYNPSNQQIAAAMLADLSGSPSQG
jgi:flagellar biosynthesis anti-sigma factor FlgM